MSKDNSTTYVVGDDLFHCPGTIVMTSCNTDVVYQEHNHNTKERGRLTVNRADGLQDLMIRT